MARRNEKYTPEMREQTAAYIKVEIETRKMRPWNDDWILSDPIVVFILTFILTDRNMASIIKDG